MNALRLVVLALATWRLSHLLVLERGPFGVFEALRQEAEGTEFGKMLDCVWCVSVWVAALLLLIERVWRWPATLLGVAAGALLVDRVVNGE